MGFNGEKIHSDDVNAMDNEDSPTSTPSRRLDIASTSDCSTDKDAGVSFCRVCHCAESDRRGEAALGFLGIVPPSQQTSEKHENEDSNDGQNVTVKKDEIGHEKSEDPRHFVEFISPEGEVFICSVEEESSSNMHQDALIDLGCSCKNDLGLAHYACALKWFVSHGSTICEICGNVASSVRVEDFLKVMASLKDYEALRERTVTGELTHVHTEANTSVDPDAVAAIRRQRLREISLWFNPQNSSLVVVHEAPQQFLSIPTENYVAAESPATRWAMECTGILVASGLLTVTLVWLLAPRVGKRTAKVGLTFLLAGICALAVVVFIRFVVLSRIKYGPARYWIVLFVFWFLVFGVWASRTRNIRAA